VKPELLPLPLLLVDAVLLRQLPQPSTAAPAPPAAVIPGPTPFIVPPQTVSVDSRPPSPTPPLRPSPAPTSRPCDARLDPAADAADAGNGGDGGDSETVDAGSRRYAASPTTVPAKQYSRFHNMHARVNSNTTVEKHYGRTKTPEIVSIAESPENR